MGEEAKRVEYTSLLVFWLEPACWFMAYGARRTAIYSIVSLYGEKLLAPDAMRQRAGASQKTSKLVYAMFIPPP